MVANTAIGKAIPLVRYGLLRGAAALGNRQAATTLVGDALSEQIARTQLPNSYPLLNVGQMPKQTFKVTHAINEEIP